jgi:cation diffusion facilitator CzcD-associated flavoprotein CzcO
MNRDQVETLVIGGGQARLAAGYHLRRRGLPFVIVDEHERVGDVWRKRWDTLRLFTPGRYNGLAGMRQTLCPSRGRPHQGDAPHLEVCRRRAAIGNGAAAFASFFALT